MSLCDIFVEFEHCINIYKLYYHNEQNFILQMFVSNSIYKVKYHDIKIKDSIGSREV